MTVLRKQKDRRAKRYFEFQGHYKFIYNSIKAYAKKWNVPIMDQKAFYAWAENDPEYARLFYEWEDAGFPKHLGPIVIRKIKSLGFVLSQNDLEDDIDDGEANMFWDYKDNYSWWSREADLVHQIGKDLEEEQMRLNEGTPEWRRKTMQKIRELRLRGRL